MNRKHIALNYRMRGGFVLLAMIMLAPFLGWGQQTNITSLSQITAANGHYVITQDITGGTPGVTNFSGTLEANINPATKMPYRIKDLSTPLFATLTGTVKNLVLEDVAINGHNGNTGAIACTANSAARIYNVGILSGEVGGTAYTGGLVGLLDGTARVVNCYSFATITGGTTVGGIVGYNNQTTTAASMKTMVMNCMFYGDITGGNTISPVYGGNNINNLATGGVNTFNYYAYDKLKTKKITETGNSNQYNCALAAEEKYLTRFELYRLLLNSNKKLAAFYATDNAANASQMLKWVLETADRTNDNPYPYPILKAQGYYPSIINPDIANAPDSTAVGPNKGGKLGRTLTVNISNAQTTGGQTKPAGASITTSSLILQRTDKDFDRFNFNYDKVQLPYYNDVGTGNYTGNCVVTGWKITAITPVANDPYTGANYDDSQTYAQNRDYFDYPNFNFADRKSSNKDLYSVSGRVFSQGAYFDVPYGVTSITIEPYWGQAAYLADANYDVVYGCNGTTYTNKTNVTETGTQVNNNTTFNGQTVKKTIADALGTLNLGSTVYDKAIVLVGNFHQDDVPSNGNTAFTIMSVDEDNDREPDYSLIYHHYQRSVVCPIRFDFLSMPGTAQAQKPYDASILLNYTIFKTKGWFEVTNTAFFYSNQIEYENLNGINNRVNAPLILLGGVFDQFVSTQRDAVPGKTIYIHLGGNVWIDQFGLGTHGDGSKFSPHIPVSVTGGEYKGFYLSGTYNQNADVEADNAECYISGGHFVEAAGGAQEKIDGDMHWQIYNADIDDFYGGGTNGAMPITGDVTIDIFNSHVTTYCGGPKFGDMQSDKKVTTNADGCTFGKFFGAGYGGLSYSRKKYYDKEYPNYNFLNQQKYYFNPGSTTTHENERGKYYDGVTTNAVDSRYGKKGPGVATDFDYEFFVWSSGKTGARFYIKFATFSLAQCNNVESNLKNCTINGNFYGGGNLGKVIGTVTSELDGCTVKGNVFGAGFSATLPTLQVRDSAFRRDANGNYLVPKFNKHAGVFEPGTFSGTTEFNWYHKDNYPNNGSIGFLNDEGNYNINGQNVVTTLDINKTNLGSVNEVSLTLKGNTTVGDGTAGTGNVFGGGDESVVSCNTTVTLQGNTNILGNVYGGGNLGAVGGNSSVSIEVERDGNTEANPGHGTEPNPQH